MTLSVAPRGFTLLELLVALVVLGFIFIGLSQGVRYGLRATETQTRLSTSRGDLDAVDRALRRLIEQADPGTAHSGPTLRGTAERLLFTSELPAAAAGTARHADIALVTTPDRRLVLRWTPHLHAQRLAPPPPPQEAELLGGIDHIELSYWSGTWTSTWEKDILPASIRIRLVFPANDPRHWPDIVTRPLRQRSG